MVTCKLIIELFVSASKRVFTIVAPKGELVTRVEGEVLRVMFSTLIAAALSVKEGILMRSAEAVVNILSGRFSFVSIIPGTTIGTWSTGSYPRLN